MTEWSARAEPGNRRNTTRRAVLTAMGLGLTVLGCGAPERPPDAGRSPAAGGSPATGSGAIAPPGCVLTPEGTEGPFYLDLDLVRRDISGGRPGQPLSLRVTVVDERSCTPIAEAAVDIWQADANGVYSGFGEFPDATFLRGIQLTDAQGAAVFDTVVPGWYDNRTAHIHLKTHVGGDEIHTGQLYFEDRVIDELATMDPYSKRTSSRTKNDGDFLFARGGAHSILNVTRAPDARYRADIVVGVRV